MSKDNELENLRQKKIQAMLSQTENQQPQNNQPIIITDGTFQTAAQTHEVLVVDFWAPWCGPCRMVGPIIEELSKEYSGKITFGKINVDENQTVPNSFGIMGIPTIIVFHHGKETERIVGAYPKVHIQAILKRYLQ